MQLHKDCVICGNSFSPKHYKNITCSDSCFLKNRNKTANDRYKKNIEKRREYSKTYRKTYRKLEHVKKYDKHMDRVSNLKKFGLTIEQYDNMLQSQNSVCKICGKPELAKVGNRLAVDHCHKTGKVRGLLCSLCNKGIGHFYDSVELLQKTIDYLNEGSSG